MKVGVFRGDDNDPLVIKAIDAFVDGLQYLGLDYFYEGEEYQPCDVAVVWGIASQRFYDKTAYRDVIRAKQPNTIVLERGFIKRDKYFAAGWDDTGGRADFCNAGSPPDRWERLNIKMKPWKEGGDYILVLGQIPWDTSVQHIDYSKWLCETIDQLVATGDPVVFRNHPKLSVPFGPFEKVYPSSGSLEEDLVGASVVVTCNSTSAVDATLAGVQVVPADGRCMVPQGPFDREQWARDIAYTQWRLHEFRKGLAFKHLIEGRGL